MKCLPFEFQRHDDDYDDLVSVVQDCGFSYFQILLRKLSIEKGMTKESLYQLIVFGTMIFSRFNVRFQVLQIS